MEKQCLHLKINLQLQAVHSLPVAACFFPCHATLICVNKTYFNLSITRPAQAYIWSRIQGNFFLSSYYTCPRNKGKVFVQKEKKPLHFLIYKFFQEPAYTLLQNG